MKAIITELHYPKSTDFESKVGGFNILNVPDELIKPTFWEDYNKIFLDKAIARGDDIVLATKPVGDNIRKNGVLTGFGKEYYYLLEKGYYYDELLSKMVKG